ncbi:MAG: FHA domain-containing protein [Chloroflexi bacterium]|nr:FHA domain-containing protein [Chloroflexota bacterium]
MKDRLDRMELRLQALVEGGFASLLPWGNPRHTLAHRLVAAMQENLVVDASGRSLAPNVYTISVHPEKLPYWQAEQPYLEQIAQQIARIAADADIHFAASPELRLSADANLPLAEYRLSLARERSTVHETAAMPPSTSEMVRNNRKVPLNAFLIVDGKQIFPLKQPVVNIGRRPDNHLVLDDPRISRAHAQLRAIHGRYTLFDLNSTGGTYVNGQRVARYDLNPGDVISIAGVPLIYGQDIQTVLPDQPASTAGIPPGTTQSLSTVVPDRHRKKHDR